MSIIVDGSIINPLLVVHGYLQYFLAIFLLQIINMVAHSSEFENIVVREEEQDELEKLWKVCCPLEVKGGLSDKHGKISILIQVIIISVDPPFVILFQKLLA